MCSNTLDICLCLFFGHVQSVKSLEVSALILRVLFYFEISDVFGGGSEAVSEFSHHSCMIWFDLSHPKYSGVIRSYLWVFECLTARLAALLSGVS